MASFAWFSGSQLSQLQSSSIHLFPLHGMSDVVCNHMNLVDIQLVFKVDQGNSQLIGQPCQEHPSRECPVRICADGIWPEYAIIVKKLSHLMLYPIIS